MNYCLINVVPKTSKKGTNYYELHFCDPNSYEVEKLFIGSSAYDKYLKDSIELRKSYSIYRNKTNRNWVNSIYKR